MITVNLLCVGKLKERYLREACAEYQKRLTKFCKWNIFELSEQTILKEGNEILCKCSGFVTALCVEGTMLTSEEFADFFAQKSMQHSKFTFIVGGSYGLSDAVKARADMRLSFSKMTFPHQLMRVIFMEQLYRAFTINGNITYHK